MRSRFDAMMLIGNVSGNQPNQGKGKASFLSQLPGSEFAYIEKMMFLLIVCRQR